jgi:5-methyltetrahydropteroyltriglutamate--homocysteine methyltransferase
VLQRLQNKTIILGVIALDTPEIETPEIVAERLQRALPYHEDLIAAPDCGMKYLPRESAFGKLQALVAGRTVASG